MPDPSIIYVDYREAPRTHSTGPHSGRTLGTDMLALVRSHRTHPVAEHRTLTAGDFCFPGDGPKGPCLIGIERKRIKDMLTSMRTGRFDGEQLPKLLDHYDFSYLVVEGRWRTNWATGQLECRDGSGWSTLTVGQSTFLGLELESYLNTIMIRTPVRVIRTHDERGTVECVMDLHHWWNKPWSQHRDTMGLYAPDPQQLVSLSKASTLRRVANQLSNVGWDRSGKIEEHYHSVVDLCSAEPSDLMRIPGIGKTIAHKIYNELRGVHE